MALATWHTVGHLMDVLVIGGIFREVLNADSKPIPRYGGSGLTASVAAARFGAQVTLASYVGVEDEEAVRAELRLAGVDDSTVLSAPGASGTFLFPTHGDQNRPWPMYRPAESLPQDMPQGLSADIVVVFGIPDCDPVELGWLGASENYQTVIWDRQGWLSRARDASAILQIKSHRRIYIANEFETIEDARANSLSEALMNQPPSGFDVSVIKRGEAGVIAVEATKNITRHTNIPAFPVRTPSTIGSGDIFAGVFAACLMSGEPVEVAAKMGCAAVAVSLKSGHHLLNSEAYLQTQELISA